MCGISVAILPSLASSRFVFSGSRFCAASGLSSCQAWWEAKLLLRLVSTTPPARHGERQSCYQAVTVGVHGEEKKKRLHVLTALVLFFLLLKTTCADSPRSSAPFLVEQLRNRTSCTLSVTAWSPLHSVLQGGSEKKKCLLHDQSAVLIQVEGTWPTDSLTFHIPCHFLKVPIAESW